MMVPAKDLKLGDVIQAFDHDCFGCATVKKIDESSIYLYRPYVHHADFSCTGGVICYTGIEEYSIARDGTLYHRWRKGDVE